MHVRQQIHVKNCPVRVNFCSFSGLPCFNRIITHFHGIALGLRAQECSEGRRDSMPHAQHANESVKEQEREVQSVQTMHHQSSLQLNASKSLAQPRLASGSQSAGSS
jgi:hypothetical protein